MPQSTLQSRIRSYIPLQRLTGRGGKSAIPASSERDLTLAQLLRDLHY